MERRKASLRKRWESLQSPPRGTTGSALRHWKRDRGYQLEGLLFDLARHEQLEARRSYRGTGEQIDGYFIVDYRHFLLEAKWQEHPVTASDVYAFRGKLQGKLVGTLGLFVSISDFTDDVALALSFGKELNILLATREDIQLALEPERTFQEMVRAKIQAAAQRGDVYYAYQRWLEGNP